MEVEETTGVQSSGQIITNNKPTPNFLQVGCPSCHPANSVKALTGKCTYKTSNVSHSGGISTTI